VYARVEVPADEPFEAALCRFRKRVTHRFWRPWHKRRFGFYEKPSALRRKRRKMRELARGRATWRDRLREVGSPLFRLIRVTGHVGLGLRAQFDRNAPTFVVGR
jgi:ribosomal protein S21